MKAWVSHRPGGPETLVWQELPDPVPAEGEVLVKIAAVGVNYPDGLLIRDLYQVRPERPFVPGSEFCGVVEQAGPGVSGLREGDLVIGRCGWGAMADRIAVAEQRCVRVPADTPRTQAAAFMFAYATAYHALCDAAQLRAQQTVLVLGAAGGVGSAAVEVAHALGARVVAAVSSPSKLAFAMARGASCGLVYEQQVEGLFRIDEAALNALPADALAEVRDANALALAYCQLLSQQRLQALGKLAHERNEAEKALGFGQDNGTFSFGA